MGYTATVKPLYKGYNPIYAGGSGVGVLEAVLESGFISLWLSRCLFGILS